MFYYITRYFQELSFGPRTTVLGVATAFTMLMIIITSSASAQVEDNNPTFFNLNTSQAQLLDTEQGVKEQTEISSYQARVPEEEAKKEAVEYVTKKGDTVVSIAKEHGVSPNTVRWANNIWWDEIAAGTKLKILPVSGLEHTIQAGDSVRSIAKEYDAHAATVVTYNGLEADKLKNGQIIVIPDGIKPLPKPAYRSYRYGSANDPSGYNTVVLVTSKTPTYSGNGYPWGNCTWYVSNRRAELGYPVPNKLGNAGAWARSASSRGFKVNKSPAVGAVLVESGKGHVAIVESINADGSVTISEMNFNWRLGVKTNRTIPASSVGYHSYIH